MAKKSKTPEKLLTEVELEIMSLVWELGTPTVKEVQEKLPKSRALAYTSVATVMKILETKGFLKSTKSDRAHTYEARVPRADYEGKMLRHVTQKLFDGNPTTMVARLIDENDLTRTELEAIRELLEKRMK